MLNKPINPWCTVVAGAFGCIFGAGSLMSYGFGILARNMIAEFGWSRDVAANLFGMFMVGSALGLLILGWLIARYGIRVPSLIFVLAFGACFAAVAISPPIPAIFLLLFLVVGIGGAAASVLPYAVAISGFFDVRRGLALGIVVAGGGLGSIVIPQLAERLVEGFGWRVAFATIGLAAGLIPGFGLAVLVRTPPGAVAARATGVEEEPSIVRMCLLSPAFWLIALPILSVSIATIGALSSYVFLFADRGIPTATVTTILSVAGLVAWFGRPLVGYLMDRIFAPHVSASIFALAATGSLIMALDSRTGSQFVAATLIGLALGTEADILTFLVSRYFSLRAYSRVLSTIWVTWALGGATGTAIVARSYALTGSYTAALLIFAALLALAAICVCFLGPYRYPVHGRPDETGRNRPEARTTASSEIIL